LHRPTDDAPTVDIENDGEIEKAGPRWNVGDVRDPELVGRVGVEFAPDEIGSWSRIGSARKSV
jgi:hypothetical protein